MRLPMFALMTLLVAFGTDAKQGGSHGDPVVRPVITRLVGVDGPPPPEPPWMREDPKFVITFVAADDRYDCARGSAVHWASELRDFESRYQPVSVEEGAQYVAARELDIPLPVPLPAGRAPATVMLRLAVGDDGQVRDALVACSADERLNDDAIAAAKRARFTPASTRGRAVSSVETLEFVYLRR